MKPWNKLLKWLTYDWLGFKVVEYADGAYRIRVRWFLPGLFMYVSQSALDRLRGGYSLLWSMDDADVVTFYSLESAKEFRDKVTTWRDIELKEINDKKERVRKTKKK